MPTQLPLLESGMAWWVIESLCFNNESKTRFRVYEAAVGQTREQAIQHVVVSDQRLNASLMKSAIRRGEITSELDWVPISELVEYLSVTKVTTEEEIAALDWLLLEMLQEHEFFLDEINEDPMTVVGGGTFNVD
jgi:hypothetical protein